MYQASLKSEIKVINLNDNNMFILNFTLLKILGWIFTCLIIKLDIVYKNY